MEFNNIQEFDQCMPNCLICGKPLQIFLRNFANKPFTLRAQLEGQNYNFYRKTYPVNSDIFISVKNTDSKVVVPNLTFHNFSLFKKCKTCRFQISCKILPQSKNHLFFQSKLLETTIYFTLSNNEQIFLISQNLGFYCYINNRLLTNNLNIDLQQFKSYKQLMKKINLIKTFG